MSQGGLASASGISVNKVVQSLNSISLTAVLITSIIPYDNTIPQQTEGTEVLTLSITPTKATNTLIIKSTYAGETVMPAPGAISTAALFQDTTANALGASTISSIPTNINQRSSARVVHVMTAGTTSLTTFKLRLGGRGLVGESFTPNGVVGARRFGGSSKTIMQIYEIEV